jgi:hypothetical protein
MVYWYQVFGDEGEGRNNNYNIKHNGFHRSSTIAEQKKNAKKTKQKKGMPSRIHAPPPYHMHDTREISPRSPGPRRWSSVPPDGSPSRGTTRVIGGSPPAAASDALEATDALDAPDASVSLVAAAPSSVPRSSTAEAASTRASASRIRAIMGRGWKGSRGLWMDAVIFFFFF